jgi:hypothetical protein
MMQAQELAPQGEAAMTWKEICERYPDQWVVLVDTDWVDNHNFDFRSACVVGHDARRAAALAEARPVTAHCQRFGCFFTGPKRGPLPRFYLP